VSTPTIDEVAAAAGVHRSTVSRAFSRPEAVKRETRDHVRQTRGMTPIELDSGAAGVGAGEHAAPEFTSLRERPTAVIAGNDLVAFGLISSLGLRGVSVPGDVSVVGFDGLPLGARSNPPLTSVQQPIAEMGRIAIHLAEQAANGGPVEHVVLQPQLLVRSSTRPVR